MTEFKKLGEVEMMNQAPEEATVLIESGGNIKRVPAKEVGGAGGYIIRMSEAYIGPDGMLWIDSSYDELYDVLAAGGYAWMDLTGIPQPNNPTIPASGSDTDVISEENEYIVAETAAAVGLQTATNCGAAVTAVFVWQMTDVGMMVVAFTENGELPVYFPNGSHNLEPIERDPK